ncbi:hypothetical protein ANFP_27440 [Acidithiobacillus ferrooxidans]|nr:hypothetical protein ANFP_27440 [Acidithiobacillus ferrooxidans]
MAILMHRPAYLDSEHGRTFRLVDSDSRHITRHMELSSRSFKDGPQKPALRKKYGRGAARLQGGIPASREAHWQR